MDGGGLVVTVGQLGYCLGLLLVAPLADILDNRRLLVTTLAVSALSMVVGATASSGKVFMTACFGIGLASTAVQMIVAQAALSSPPPSRGKVVGQVTGGLLFGILLAWPIANIIAGQAGWRTLYALESAAITADGWFVPAVTATTLGSRERSAPFCVAGRPLYPLGIQRWGAPHRKMGRLAASCARALNYLINRPEYPGRVNR
jgi:predicted MFS family arabinose efflux permease